MTPEPAGALNRTCTAELAPDLTAPRTARSLVVLLLRHWGAQDEDVLDGATVVVSELVTNALVHGVDGDPIVLDLHLDDARLVLSVADRSPAVPAQRAADDQAGGRPRPRHHQPDRVPLGGGAAPARQARLRRAASLLRLLRVRTVEDARERVELF